MWVRYLIKCGHCDKITNFRTQVPPKEVLEINSICKNCGAEIRADLLVDFENISWRLNVHRGELIKADLSEGDYFVEISDVLPTNAPSTEPHSPVLPTFRINSSGEAYMFTEDYRQAQKEKQWDDFKDLTRFYIMFDKTLMKKLLIKMVDEAGYGHEYFYYKRDFDYHLNYTLMLNRVMSPWIDYGNYLDFVDWLLENIFNSNNQNDTDLIDFLNNVMTVDYCDKVRKVISELIFRFSDLRGYFLYVNPKGKSDGYAAIHDFERLKSFYVDCFEFVGDNSHLIFRLQNFHERGGQDIVPHNCRKDVKNSSDFHKLKHGMKVDVINLSQDPVMKQMFVPFDHKLRNGINHFNTAFDNTTQIITYYPNPNKPDIDSKIKYMDFLSLSLDLFTSVLKIESLITNVEMYKCGQSAN